MGQKTSFIWVAQNNFGQSSKRDIICSLKKIKSAFPVKTHTFIMTTFHKNLLSSFSGVVLTNCFSSIFNFSQISKFQKGHYSQKKNWSRIFCGYAHLQIKSFITTKFHEILLSGFRGVALTNCFSSIFHFGQISKFKQAVIPREKNESKFTVDMHTFITTKFCEILLSGFRGVVLTNCSFWPNF